MKNKNNVPLKNYLDYIPVHSEKYSYSISDGGNVTIYMENTSSRTEYL